MSDRLKGKIAIVVGAGQTQSAMGVQVRFSMLAKEQKYSLWTAVSILPKTPAP